MKRSLPYPKRSFDGYRLLQEYFTFSEKFLFFELSGLEAIAEAGCDEQAEILFCFSRFDRPERQQDLEIGRLSAHRCGWVALRWSICIRRLPSRFW